LLKTKIEEKYIPVLKQLVLNSVSKTLMQVNELKELERIFEEQAITNQVLKGAVMKFIYPAPEMREMSDIDMLVHEEDMVRAANVLCQRGYSLQKEETIELHDVYMKRPYMCVELHRALYDKTVGVAQYEYFKDLSKRVLKEGCQYTYDFSKEEFYVYMMAHMAKHFAMKGCGIRNLVDIYVYNQKFQEEMNREIIERELIDCGILTFAKHMEKLSKIWLEGEESSGFYDDLFEYMLNAGIYGKGQNDIWHKFAQESISEEEVNQKMLKHWFWFPPISYMEKRYTWLKKRPYLLLAAWMIRGFKGLVLKTGEDKQDMIKDISVEEIHVYKKIYEKMDLNFK